jgi:hypothetical protein
MAKSAEQIRADIEKLRRFIDEADRAGLVIPPNLKLLIIGFDKATDVGVEFERVCKELDTFYKNAEASIAAKYDPNDWQAQDQQAIEEVQFLHRHNHQKEAVRVVLAIDDDKSMAAQLWKKWKPEIAGVIKDKTKSGLKALFEQWFK